MSAKPVVISYLRFSRPEQLKGDSIRRQLAMGEEWANKHGLKIADSFRDLGISAFRGKNAAEGALSQLLSLVDSGRIPRGSILLVEQLDRLSRSAVLEALELFLSIIRRGLKVVTLMDSMEYDRESLSRNVMGLQYSIMQMSLAHEESAKKSERLAHAWKSKRDAIKEKPLTRLLPAWLKIENGKIVVIEEKAKIVRQIIRWIIEGYGPTVITKKLNAQYEGLARVKYFNRSYVFKIIKSRALFGEYQPHKMVHENGKKRRVPVGDPIAGYFPAVIDQKTYYAIQKQLAARRRSGGPQSHFVNLFSGLLYDAKDGSRLNIQDKGLGKRYVSSAAILGRKGASPYVSYPVDVFERALLLQLHDLILPRLTKPDDTDSQVEADALEARIAEVDRKIEKTQEMILNDSAVNTVAVVGMLTKLDAQKATLIRHLETLHGEIAARSTLDLDDATERLAVLVRYYKKGKVNLSDDDRVQLRRIISQVIERVDCDLSRNSHNYAADLKIKLCDGSTLQLTVFAEWINTMKRNAKGHPIKSGPERKAPQYRVGVGEPRWLAISNDDGSTVRVAKAGSRKRVDVEVS